MSGINFLVSAGKIGLYGTGFKMAAYAIRSSKKSNKAWVFHGAGNFLYICSLYMYLSKVAPAKLDNFQKMYWAFSIIPTAGGLAVDDSKPQTLPKIALYVTGEVVSFIAIGAIVSTPFIEQDPLSRAQCQAFSMMQAPVIGAVGYSTLGGLSASGGVWRAIPTNLPSFMKDLTETAQEKVYIEPEGLIDDIKSILLAEDDAANNVMLRGESGSGKTALAEHLAVLIKKGELAGFENCRVYSCTAKDMIADQIYVGQVAGNVKKLEKFIEGRIATGERVILFIDEIHQLIGAGTSIGNKHGVDQYLLTLLTNPKLHVIGATTPLDYHHFNGNVALSNRFTKLDLPVLSPELKRNIMTAVLKKHGLPENLTNSDVLRRGVPRDIHRLLALTKSRMMNVQETSAEDALKWAARVTGAR